MEMRKKKILFVIPSLAGGGAEKVLVLVLRNLDRGLFEPVVVAFEAKNDYKTDMPGDVSVISLGKKGRLDNLRLVFSLSSVIRDEKPDLICGFLYYANYVAAIAKRLSGSRVPLVFTEHNNLTLIINSIRFPSLKRALMRRFRRDAASIVCVSRGVKDDLVSNWGIPERKCVVINNPVEIENVRRLAVERPVHPWFGDDTPVIVACGRLTEQKNFSLLLNAVSLVSKSRDVRLIIIGEGAQRPALLSLAKELGISDRVDMPGFQANPFKYMASATVFALSSKWEGFGNVIVEAMACGAPVVSTRCPFGPEEIITDGVDGLLVPSDDAHALAEALSELIDDASARAGLSKEGRKRAEDFGARKIIAEYEGLFGSLLRVSGAAARSGVYRVQSGLQDR